MIHYTRENSGNCCNNGYLKSKYQKLGETHNAHKTDADSVGLVVCRKICQNMLHILS